MKKGMLKIAAITFAAMLALAFVPFFQPAAKADGMYDQDSGFIYDNNPSGGYTIVGYIGADTDVTIPAAIDGTRVTAIDSYAFEADFDNNGNVATITFPTLTAADLSANGPIQILGGALADLPDLTKVDFANSAQLDFSDSVQSPESLWFYGDTSLSTFACADDSQYLKVSKDDGALFSADGKTLYAYPPAKGGASYTIPSAVTALGNGCFGGCTSLTDITLPDSLSAGVSSVSFGDCTQLAHIIANPTSAHYNSWDGVLFSEDSKQLLVYPPAKQGDYTVPASVTSLAYGSFDLAAKLTAVSLPAGLADMGKSPINTDNPVSYFVNPFEFSPQLASITVDASNTHYQMVNGVLIKTDDNALIAYPPGRTATDPSIYSVKKPVLQARHESGIKAVEKLAGVPAAALTEKEFKVFSKIAQSQKPKAQSGNTVKVVTNGAGMTGSYAVPDSIEIIAEGAFYNTTLAVVTFGIDSAIGSDGIAPNALPSDGSVSIAAYTSFDHYLDLKTYAAANGIPFIDMNVSASDSVLLFEPNENEDGAIVTGLKDPDFVGDVTIPDKVTIDGTEYPVTEVGSWAFADTGITHVAIPNSVTALDDFAFAECESLFGTLKLPDSVTSIGNGCFSDCEMLNYAVLPANLQTLGDGAFAECFDLSELTLPAKLETIGPYCFEGCDLESVAVPDSVTDIGEWCFQYCESLKSVTLPSGLAHLKPGTFFKCESLTGVTIPDSVTFIGEECFASCSSLPSISIPKNVATIEDLAFSNCDMLAAFIVDNDNAAYKDVEGVLFSKDGTVLMCYPIAKTGADYIIPSNTSTVQDLAFSGDCPVQTIHMPASVVSADNAFMSGHLRAISVDGGNLHYANYNGDGVLYNYFKTKIIVYPRGKPDAVYSIPGTVKSLGAKALDSCQFATVNIPAGLTSISAGAFTSCPHLTNFVVASGNKVYASRDGVLYGNTKKTALLAFPTGRTGTYWVPGGVTVIMDDAFYSCGLTAIYFPASVTTVGKYACAESADLTTAAFFGTRYKTTGEDDIFYDTDDSFTVYYHITKAASWSHYKTDTDYYSQPFVMLTLNYQDSQKSATNLAPVEAGLISEPNEPVARAGCTFSGWYKDAACTTKNAWDFDSSIVKGDTTLYVRWVIDTPPSVDLTAQNYNTILVQWKPMDSAAGYVVERYTTASGKYTVVATTKSTVTSFVNKNVTTGTTYYYIVRAFTQAGKNKFYGSFSSPVSVATALNTPNMPYASPASYSSVKLSWDKVTGATKYVLYRSTVDDPNTAKAIKTTSSRSYTDNGAMLNTYYYWVRAWRTNSYSDWSESKEVETALSTPVITSAKANAGIVTVSWKAVTGATGYIVSVDGSPTKDITKTSCTFGLTEGDSYDITVTAYRTVNGIRIPSNDSDKKPVTT